MKKTIITFLLAMVWHGSFADTYGDWEYSVSNSEATITGYSGSGGAVTIPGVINGVPVKRVGKEWPPIFGYNDGTVTSITIPGSVTNIGNAAFYGCAGLTNVTIPSSVTTIGSSAFQRCTSLTSISIPNSVTSIGEAAFYNCTRLTDITIPNSATSIGNAAFSGCPLKNSNNFRYLLVGDHILITQYTGNESVISIPNSLDNFPVTSIGGGAFSNRNSLTSISIPNSVTSIGDYAFSNTSLTSITIPNSVTSIGDGAFSSCNSLTSISIPSSVTSIGKYAFSSCSRLTSVNIDTTNPNFASLDGVLYDKAITSLILYPFGKNDPTFTIPNGVISIGNYSFGNCTNLTSINIPNSVTSIGEYSFSSCASLTSFNADPSNTTFASLDGVLYDKAKTTLILYPRGKKDLNFTIPNGVTSVGDWAFQNCDSLTSISLPNGVISIGNYSFGNCANLTNINLPDSITSIGLAAFAGCYNLTDILIPNNVITIKDLTFSECGNLTRVTIPNNVTRIGAYAFYNCNRLFSINIPNNLTSIGEYAFSNTEIDNIYIPDSCKKIGTGALSSWALTHLNLPERFSDYIFTYTVDPDNNIRASIRNLTIRDKGMQYLYPEFLNSLASNSNFIDALANNDAFVTAVANKIRGTIGTYGIATSNDLGVLATKNEITTAINEGKSAGIASVTASPNTWSLFTSSQIQNMAIGDLVLTREVNGNFVLNYDIEQSNDLVNWSVYSANTQIVKLPADKAFVRIKAKQ